MKYIVACIGTLLILTNNSRGQIVSFSDFELKMYLISEQCVDTTHNGISFSNDRSVDINGDGEIQLSEALCVEAIEITDFGNNYTIKSLLDLNEFSNLEYLKIIDNDSLRRVSNLNLDSLKTLWISNGISLSHIDISNLPNITTTLRIEGITTLDTINLRNGTMANQFSLFYCQNIKYACIDSIAGEINEFINSGAMMPGANPTFNCDGVFHVNEVKILPNIRIFPNPVDNNLIVETKNKKVDIRIFDRFGRQVIQSGSKYIDVSMLSSGLYLLKCRTGNNIIVKKIFVQ